MLRRTVSLTGFTSFLVLLVSSVVLYFEPHGRVAYWGDWRFLGLTKTDWDHMHLGVGVLFLAACLLHLWLNWTPLTTYMKNRARELIVLTPAMVVSLLLTLYFTIGSVAGLPGVSQILDFSAWLKDAQTETYGNPPYGHAELSTLERFVGVLGFDPDESVAALEAAGLTGASKTAVVADIARQNSKSPQEVYDILRLALAHDPFAALPPQPPEGTGRMTLADICQSYGLELDAAMGRLAAAGVAMDRSAAENEPFKTLAEAAGLSPRELYALLRTGGQ